MVEKQLMPVVGETVVCRVKQVLDYGAFVELVEYNDMKGFVHISQISTGWVKNVRNHVKEGTIRAAKVLMLNRDRNQLDLSFTKVSEAAQRVRIEEWKQLKRSRKMLEILAQEQKVAFEEIWNAIAKPLLENYSSLNEAFQNIALSGQEAAEGVQSKWLKPLVEIVEKNVPVPKKTVKGMLSLRCMLPNGVDAINAILQKAEKNAGHEIEIFYNGGGKYSVKVTEFDFKSAEKALSEVSGQLLDSAKAAGCEAKFERGEK